MTNPTIEMMLQRKSIRKYEERVPSDEIIKTIVQAGQQAPFAAQIYSVLLSRNKKHAFGAPLLFTICVDFHKMRLIMKKRNWDVMTNDLSILIFGIQDAAMMAENMVIAAESLGLGSVYLGNTPYVAEKIIAQYNLPPKVFPLVQLAMGYPAEEAPPRPRYPMDFVLFEGEYPELTDEMIEKAMDVMDQGYMTQDYYRKGNIQIPLKEGREETYSFDTYGWTEHISRKWGQWYPSVKDLLIQLEKCGFKITED